MKYISLLIVGLCFHLSSRCQGVPMDENETRLEKIFENKDDVDFEFYRGGGQTSSIKYFFRNDSLWFGGTNLYTTVIPLSNIDFERTMYYLESSLYKTKENNKCIEVPLYAIKGKQYGKEFEIEAFRALEPGPIDFANLVLPDKPFAEAFIKYLKLHLP
jgi:hypothetical protein